MSLCESIDTLSMAYLDDELAAEERRELEAHLTECSGCRSHVDAERADHALIARALAVPPAPDLLRARIARSLDGEDKAEQRAERTRWASYVLPGSAIIAAAAAIAVFVGVKPVETRDASAVASKAIRQINRQLPYDVQGPGVREWSVQHAGIAPPPCQAQQLGARATEINGHDAMMYAYQMDVGRGPFVLTGVVMKDVAADELDSTDETRMGRRLLHVIHDDQGHAGVTYVDDAHRGYMFFAPAIDENELLSLVNSCLGP